MSTLRQFWHSPRTGPVILILVGLPALALAVALVAAPVLVLVGLARSLVTTGAFALPGANPAVLATLSGLWLLIIGLALKAHRVARANRGLDRHQAIAVRQLPDRPARKARQPDARVFATWLRGVVAEGGLDLDLSPVIREDYGAGFWAVRGRDRFWVAIADQGPTPAGARAFGLSATYDAGFDPIARLRHRADRARFEALWASIDRALDLAPHTDRITT